MTRAAVPLPVYAWICDRCGTRHGLAYGMAQLDSPAAMRAFGWFIAPKWGDLCPACVREGGKQELRQSRSGPYLETALGHESIREGSAE